MRRLFSRSQKRALTPDGARVYAIGDIHGEAALLDAILEKIEADARSADSAKFVFLGDYVDRGPDSKGVLERLIAVNAERPDTVFLKGNHEAAMLDFLANPDGALEWLEWGGEETLRSYGVSNALSKSSSALAEDLHAALPHIHRDFLHALDLTHIEGDYLFVHAGVRPGVALDDQQEEDLLWIRKTFHDASPDQRPPHTIVHGHHPTRKPVDAGWRIGIDTGACWSGVLTAVVLEGETRRFLST